MMWTAFRVVLATGGVIVIYLVGAALVRNFATGIPSAEDLEPPVLADVDHRFRCVVCSAEVVMYAAPDGEIPLPPRHCAERMELIVPISD